MAAVIPRGNLEARAQDMQLRVGLVSLAVSLVVGSLLASGGVATSYRLLSFVPFFVAANGVLSALYQTCGFTAIAGRRITSEGTEPVADRDELAQQRARGMRVMLGSSLLAAVATSLLFLAK
jgi:hypothetical protein